MTLSTVAWRNLWRNPVRTALTLVSLAVSLFLFTLLLATVDALQEVAAESARQLRLVVHHKSTVTKLLPLGHGPKIAALPGVRAVCGMRWFGGRLEQSQEQFPSLAVDAGTFPIVFDDFELSSGELGVWHARRTAAVLGSGLARRIGCAPGDRVVLAATVPPYLKLEFRVVAITHAAAYPNVFVFRLDYLVESLRADPMMPPSHDDAVNTYWIRTEGAESMDALRRAVDATFATGTDPTMTEPEQAFVAHFTKMFGDIPRLIRNVGVLVVASILLVVCNTLSSAVRERIGELAVFTAIGFGRRKLFAMLFGEALWIGLFGGCGALAALLVFGLSDAAGLSMPYFPTVSVSLGVVGWGVLTGVALSLVAAMVPAWYLARLSVIEALRDEG